MRTPVLLVALVSGGCGTPEGWPEDTGPFTVSVPSEAGSIEGIVWDATGEPLPDVHVTTLPGGRGTVTDTSGAFELDRVRPGTYVLVAAHELYEPTESETFEVSHGTVSTVEMALAEPVPEEGVVRVRVEGPDGSPREGITVTAGSMSGQTDVDGSAVFVGVGGTTVDLFFEDPSARLWSRSVHDVDVPELGGVDVAVSLSGRPADGTEFAGTWLCRFCHTELVDAWAETGHARSLGALEGAPTGGFDAGQTIALGADALAELGRSGEDAVVTLMDASGSTRAYPVAGVLGSPERGSVPWTEADGRAWPLPIAWLGAETDREPWPGGGGRWVSWDVETWIGPDGDFANDDLPPADASAEARCFGCHATGFTLGTDSDGVTIMGSSGRWHEPGVTCEACHGPGREHASVGPPRRYEAITQPSRLDADRANEVCGQCHSPLLGAEGTPYPWSDDHVLFTPGAELGAHGASAYVAWDNGTAAVPGAQLDELKRSAHGTGVWSARCADCHDPHGSELPALLRQDHRDNAACSSCHTSAHVGHPGSDPLAPGEPGRCTGCHMPETAARLHYDAATGAGDLSSHLFVAVPPADSVAAFAAAGASQLEPGLFPPNACAGCHAYGSWLLDASFTGVSGDPTLKTTHDAHQAAFEVLFP